MSEYGILSHEAAEGGAVGAGAHLDQPACRIKAPLLGTEVAHFESRAWELHAPGVVALARGDFAGRAGDRGDVAVGRQRAGSWSLPGEHPTQLTIPEVSRALNVGPKSFARNDAIERAIRELDGAGLLHCRGGFAIPTRTALYFARLWEL